MSVTNVSMVPDVATPAHPLEGRRGGVGARWLRLALACALLAVSGGIRWRQARQIDAQMRGGQNSPFPLKDLPLTLGAWRGESATLDPKIVQATGAVDIVTRRYVDQRTGAAIDVIVMYGPPGELYNHTPDVCYPSAGYELNDGPEERTVKVGAIEAPFRAFVFAKGEGGPGVLQEVYHSWRSNGEWSLRVGMHKQYERIPGIYKVLMSRHVTERERRDVGNPCEAFLEVLIPELERRLSAAASPRPGTP